MLNPFLQNLSLVSNRLSIVVSKSVVLGEDTVAAGTPLSELLIRRLALTLDSFSIEGHLCLDPSEADFDISKDLDAFGHSHKTISDLFDPARHSFWLSLGLRYVKSSTSLSLRLCMLKTLAPQLYQQTLFCLWFIIFESEWSERSHDEFSALFCAGLCHDLGVLDQALSGEHCGILLDDEGEHVERSAEFARRALSASEDVLLAIRQHHERIDGTGFPAGLAGRQLSEFGMQLQLFDAVFQLQTTYSDDYCNSLANLLPVIEINAVSQFGNVAFSLIELLRHCELDAQIELSSDQISRLREELTASSEVIDTTLAAMKDFTGQVGFRHEDKGLFNLQNSFIHIALVHHKVEAATSLVSTDSADASAAWYTRYIASREIMKHIDHLCRRLDRYCLEHPRSMISEQAAIAYRHIMDAWKGGLSLDKPEKNSD